MWGLEKLLNVMLDLAVPVIGALLLLFWAPVLGACSVVRRTWNWLRAPSMRGKVVLISGASSGIGEVRAHVGGEPASMSSFRPASHASHPLSC